MAADLVVSFDLVRNLQEISESRPPPTLLLPDGYRRQHGPRRRELPLQLGLGSGRRTLLSETETRRAARLADGPLSLRLCRFGGDNGAPDPQFAVLFVVVFAVAPVRSALLRAGMADPPGGKRALASCNDAVMNAGR
jgi:hypothetical protein